MLTVQVTIFNNFFIWLTTDIASVNKTPLCINCSSQALYWHCTSIRCKAFDSSEFSTCEIFQNIWSVYYAGLIWRKSWHSHGSVIPYSQSYHVFPIFRCSMLSIKKFMLFLQTDFHLHSFLSKLGSKWTKIGL